MQAWESKVHKKIGNPVSLCLQNIRADTKYRSNRSAQIVFRLTFLQCAMTERCFAGEESQPNDVSAGAGS